MANPLLPLATPAAPVAGDHGGVLALAVPQRAVARLRWGERFAATAEVEFTPVGLLAIGGMVGMILLGSAVIVGEAGKARRLR